MPFLFHLCNYCGVQRASVDHLAQAVAAQGHLVITKDYLTLHLPF